VRTAFAVVICAVAVVAGTVEPGQAGSPADMTAGSLEREVAGTLDTRVVVNRFSAVGTKVVGHGIATSVLRQSNGVTTVTKKAFRLTIRQQHTRRPQSVQQEAMCHILFLELDELDLTLLGLRVFLRSATEGEPIQLKLQARRSGGVLGRLFCDLSRGLSTQAKAKTAAKQLNSRVSNSTIMRAQAKLYAPVQRGPGMAANGPLQVPECEVLNLILGPLHLDLLGLVVDLNKIQLTITAIPGTTIGNLFCELAGGPPGGG
jgi:hypothetical protein